MTNSIETDTLYKDIIEDQLLFYVRSLFLCVVMFIPAYFIQNSSWSFTWIIGCLLLFGISSLLDYISKRNRVLISLSVNKEEVIFKYLYIFRLRTFRVPIHDLSVKCYRKKYSGVSLMTTEFRAKDKFIVEIRENAEYGWDKEKRKEMENLLYQYVRFEQ